MAYKNIENSKKWFVENKEHLQEYQKNYYQANKEKRKEYRKTPKGRAVYLVDNYKKDDKKYNRGECTITSQWVVDNIFTKPCIYCGETDWHKLGCDRKDNDLPHTPENVVSCCKDCNDKRQNKNYIDFLSLMQHEKYDT